MRTINTILLLLIMHVLMAQQGFVPLRGDDALRVAKAIGESSQKTNSIRSNFTQYKSLSILEDKITSHGSFLYKNNNKVKWQYSTPFEYTIVVADGKFLINDQGKQSQFDINANELFRQINKMMVTAISGDFVDSPDFDMELKEDKDYYIAVLKPRDSAVEQMLESISIFFIKNDMLVEKVKFNEPDGDYTLIVFDNRQENTPIDDSEFNIQ